MKISEENKTIIHVDESQVFTDSTLLKDVVVYTSDDCTVTHTLVEKTGELLQIEIIKKKEV